VIEAGAAFRCRPGLRAGARRKRHSPPKRQLRWGRSKLSGYVGLNVIHFAHYLGVSVRLISCELFAVGGVQATATTSTMRRKLYVLPGPEGFCVTPRGASGGGLTGVPPGFRFPIGVVTVLLLRRYLCGCTVPSYFSIRWACVPVLAACPLLERPHLMHVGLVAPARWGPRYVLSS
jgi:hypothetical protein